MTRKSETRNKKPVLAKAGALIAARAAASRFGVAAPVGLVSQGIRFARRNPALALAATAIAGYVATRRNRDNGAATGPKDSSVMTQLNEDQADVRS